MQLYGLPCGKERYCTMETLIIFAILHPMITMLIILFVVLAVNEFRKEHRPVKKAEPKPEGRPGLIIRFVDGEEEYDYLNVRMVELAKKRYRHQENGWYHLSPTVMRRKVSQ